ITSSNQDWIPEYPGASTTIRTYPNGLWGVHEYCRWPQPSVRNMWHVACIPSQRGNVCLPPVLWRELDPDKDWAEDHAAGMIGSGQLTSDLRDSLFVTAQAALDKVETMSDVTRPRAAFVRELALALRQCLERMERLPGSAALCIALGAHIQRLSLELHGLHTYLTVVLPRLESSQDHSRDVLPVVGIFTNDAAEEVKFVRAGVPTWRIATAVAHDATVSHGSCTPPPWLSRSLEPHTRPMAEFRMDSQNWVASMVFALSRQFGAVTYPSLANSEGEDRLVERAPKRPRGEEPPHWDRSLGDSQGRSRGRAPRRSTSPKRHRRSATSSSDVRRTDDSDSASGSGGPHPSRMYTPSPFYELSPCWMSALRVLGTLRCPSSSVTYFYPPPFLLDTLPRWRLTINEVKTWDAIRTDDKVPRYLHNLVRIREFCRQRLLDPALPGRPLTIAEWRAALWGDYQPKSSSPRRGTEARPRRARLKQTRREAIGRMFEGGACLPPYNAASVPQLHGVPVTAEAAAQDRRVRMLLLWESHEINWRCEVMALDQVVLPRHDWNVIQRWTREAQVSGVWGVPCAMLSVLPLIPRELTPFYWEGIHEGKWKQCVPMLRSFVVVLTNWPDCPTLLVDAARRDPTWTAEEYDEIQREAAKFYCSTFVRHFQRLPIVPISFPADMIV
ncbi:hypothetical protein C8Q76DRAFT_607355, partial [Earliella scabrosa]